MRQQLRFLINQPNWYGSRSGYYAQLPGTFRAQGRDVRIVAPKSGLAWRAAGKVWSAMWGLPARNQSLTTDELRFHAGWLRRPGTIGIILAMEAHLPALRYWRRAPRHLIGTLHLPSAFWTGPQEDMLRRLGSAVVLYRADLDFFTSLIGKDRVRFVHHGVDTEFFRPAPMPGSGAGRPRLLCVGQFARDFAQLDRVAPVILEKVPDAELDVIVAPHMRDQARLPRLASHPRVHFRSSISDEDLLQMYQRASVLLLPLTDAGANNAVVEALACGLPIVTTDVGGVRDYGGGDLFPVVAKGDDEGLIAETVDLVGDGSRWMSIAQRMREFAVDRLSWSRVAEDHWRVYHELAA